MVKVAYQRGLWLSRPTGIGSCWDHTKDRASLYRSHESAVWHELEDDRASQDRPGVASTFNQRVGMKRVSRWIKAL
jgi:hypothetical protein